MTNKEFKSFLKTICVGVGGIEKYKLRPEIKEKWINALRSGKYDQARNKLRTSEDTFCCLGVACDLYRLTRHRGKWDYTRSILDGVNFNLDGNEVDSVALPKSVLKWLFGIKTDNSFQEFYKHSEELSETNYNLIVLKRIKKNKSNTTEYISLANLNDDLELTFDQIATVIEQKL